MIRLLVRAISDPIILSTCIQNVMIPVVIKRKARSPYRQNCQETKQDIRYALKTEPIHTRRKKFSKAPARVRKQNQNIPLIKYIQ